MRNFFLKETVDYDGSQLRSRWICGQTECGEDAIVAFIGLCDVKPEFMVDLEDLAEGASIYSKEMLHFIVEHIGQGLSETILYQRLLICIIKEVLEHHLPNLSFVRKGDDLFLGNDKLTISIATKSPVSGLIHAGINIQSEGTPVSTKGLKDFDIDPILFGQTVIDRYLCEVELAKHCETKVKQVN